MSNAFLSLINASTDAAGLPRHHPVAGSFALPYCSGQNFSPGSQIRMAIISLLCALAVVIVLSNPANAYTMRQLQNDLYLVGEDPGIVDGVFGPRTRAALEQALAREGRSFDGRVTIDHIRWLDEAIGRSYWTRPYRRPANAHVWDFQIAVQRLGLMSGPVTGEPGRATTLAMREFFRRFGEERPNEVVGGAPTMVLARRAQSVAQTRSDDPLIAGYPTRLQRPSVVLEQTFGTLTYEKIEILSIDAFPSDAIQQEEATVWLRLHSVEMAGDPIAPTIAFGLHKSRGQPWGAIVVGRIRSNIDYPPNLNNVTDEEGSIFQFSDTRAVRRALKSPTRKDRIFGLGTTSDGDAEGCCASS